MPQIRSLLKDAAVEVAERKRTCHRNRGGHSIVMGAACLVVVDEMGGKKNYCVTCAAEILKKVDSDLHALRAALAGGSA